MKELKTEIHISSSPGKVWEVLMDLPNWKNWNPIVNKIEGQLEIGQELSITMSDKKGNDGKNYKSTITAVEEGKRFSFIGVMMAKFLFSAERIIELKANGEGTHFTQVEIYNGLMVPLFWKKLSEHAHPMLTSMNEGLKKTVEG